MGKKYIRFVQDVNYITKYGVEKGSGDGYQRCLTLDIQSSIKEHEYGIINCALTFNGNTKSLRILPANLLSMMTEVLEKMHYMLLEPEAECTLIEFPYEDPNILYFVDVVFDTTYGMYKLNICKSSMGSSEEGTVIDTIFIKPDWMVEIYEQLEELRKSVLVFNANWASHIMAFSNNNLAYRDKCNTRAAIAIRMLALCILCANVVTEINSGLIAVLAFCTFLATFGMKYKK